MFALFNFKLMILISKSEKKNRWIIRLQNDDIIFSVPTETVYHL